jgi:hypothetical protein
MEEKNMKRYRRSGFKGVYELVSIDKDEITTWYRLRNHMGVVITVGRKVFKEQFKEVE